MKMDTLLNFSGGIDSTACLYQYVTTNPDKKLLVHHIELKNSDNRWEKESEAVSNILKWFADNGYQDNIVYIRSGFDYGDIKRTLLDGSTVSLMTALILRDPKYKDLVYKIIPTPKDEYIRLGAHGLASRRNQYKNVMALYTMKTLVDIEPLKNMMKKEIMGSIPEDLLKLTWYCRHPQEDGSTCGICHTCIQVN